MWKGYIVCGASPDEARIVLAAELPPPVNGTTEWSIVSVKATLGNATYFLLRVPGTAKGLYAAVEEIMDVVGIYRDGFTGLENHRLLLNAITRVRRGLSNREEVYFTQSPLRLRLLEQEVFEGLEASSWRGYLESSEAP